jgi:hypothetical protein
VGPELHAALATGDVLIGEKVRLVLDFRTLHPAFIRAGLSHRSIWMKGPVR